MFGTARAELRDNLHSFPRAAWFLFLGTFLNRFGTFVIPFLLLYLTGAGFQPAQAGLVVGAYGVGHLAAGVCGGQLADRLGRRGTIVLSMLSSAAAMLLLSQARTLPALSGLTFLAGLCAELYRPASHALLGDLVPGVGSRRLTAFAMYRLAVNLGCAIGPAVAGLLAARSYFLLFVGDAATSLLFGAVAMLFLPAQAKDPGAATGTGGAADQEGPGMLRAVLGDPGFVRLLCGSVLCSVLFFQVESTLALHVREVGLSSRVYGAIFTVNGALIVLFEVPLSTVIGRLVPARLIAAGYWLTGIGIALSGLCGTAVTLCLATVVWTLGEMLSAPVSSALVADLAPAARRGRYMGLFSMTWSVGMMLGPTLGTLLFAQAPRALWTGCAVLGVVAAGLVQGLASGASAEPRS